MFALYEQLGVLHETATHIVTYEFMRAAHTLAGVNRTMGFKQVAELAYALEQWLEVRVDKPNIVNEQQMLLIDQVVLQLDEMCTMVREHRKEPLPQPELIAQLQANKDIAETGDSGTGTGSYSAAGVRARASLGSRGDYHRAANVTRSRSGFCPAAA